MSLKNPKKVHETEDFAIFKGKDGHELKILKKGLSEKLRKELSALPLHAAEGAYAESMQEPSDPFKMPQEEQIASYPGGATKPPAPATAGASAPAQAIKQLSPSQEAYNKEIEATSRNKSAMFSDPESMPKEFDPYAMERAKNAMERSEKAKASGEAEKQASAKKEQARREFFGMKPQQAEAPPAEQGEIQRTPSDTPPDSIFSQPAQTSQPQSQKHPEQEKHDYIQKTVAEENDEITKFDKDLMTKQITPKTYQKLFAREELHGKIGMLFGLMLAGIGSGLTGQPNVIMEMMNKEIDQDLEAQKKDQENRRNFYQYNKEHILRKAQVSRIEEEKSLLREQTKGAAVERQMKEEQLADWRKENGGGGPQMSPRELDARATVISKSQMMLAKLNDVQNAIINMPPEKQAPAQQAVDAMRASVMAQIQQSTQALAVATAEDPDSEFQRRQNRLRSRSLIGMPSGEGLAQSEQERYIPGFGLAIKPVTKEAKDEIVGTLEFEKAARDYSDFMKKNWKTFLNPNLLEQSKIRSTWEVKAANLSSAYRKATNGGQFKIGEQNFIDQVIPGEKGMWKAVISQIPKVEESINHQRMRATNTGRYLYGNKFEYPAYWNGSFYRRGPDGKPVRIY